MWKRLDARDFIPWNNGMELQVSCSPHREAELDEPCTLQELTRIAVVSSNLPRASMNSRMLHRCALCSGGITKTVTAPTRGRGQLWTRERRQASRQRQGCPVPGSRMARQMLKR